MENIAAEQWFDDKEAASLGLAVNAIDIDFNNFIGDIGLINGNIIISHAESMMTAMPDRQEVPEPATMLLFGAGLMGLTTMRRKGNGATKYAETSFR